MSKKSRRRKAVHVIGRIKPEQVAALTELSNREPFVVLALPESEWHKFKKFIQEELARETWMSARLCLAHKNESVKETARRIGAFIAIAESLCEGQFRRASLTLLERLTQCVAEATGAIPPWVLGFGVGKSPLDPLSSSLTGSPALYS